MKIISPFHDYYDYMATIYGIDDRFQYRRGRIAEEDMRVLCGIDRKSVVHDTEPLLTEYSTRLYQNWHGALRCADVEVNITKDTRHIYRDYALIIADTVYPILGCQKQVRSPLMQTFTNDGEEKYRWVTHDVGKGIADDMRQYNNMRYPWYHLNCSLDRGPSGPQECAIALELTRAAKQPVLLLESGGRYVSIHRRVPQLTKYSVHDHISAELIYQKLEYWFGNQQFTPSPDLSPPVTISDKDRIVQHGFDLKKSFRHRKD